MLEIKLKSELYTVTGDDAADFVSMVVPVGEIWIVAWAVGYHNAAAAKNCYWSLKQGATDYPMRVYASLAAGNQQSLYGTETPELLQISTVVPTFNALGLGAGETATINALVYKIRGLGGFDV